MIELIHVIKLEADRITNMHVAIFEMWLKKEGASWA